MLLSLLYEWALVPVLSVAVVVLGWFVVRHVISDAIIYFTPSRWLKLEKSSVILVTGGCSGIGQELIRILYKKHQDAILLILDIQENPAFLSEISRSGITVKFYKCDLSNPDQVQKTFSDMIRDYSRVDVLVNNAAVALITYFDVLAFDRFKKAEQINLLSYVQLTQLFLQQPNFKQGNKQKQILHMGSVAGFQVGLKTTEYASSKFGLVMFNECLRAELKARPNDGIDVQTTIINPYQVDTELFKGFTTLFQRILPTLNTKSVAEIVYKSLIQRRSIVFIAWYYEIVIFIISQLPCWARDFIGLLTLSKKIDLLQGKQKKLPGYD